MIYLQPYCICWLPSGAETEQDEAEESEATEGSEEEAAAEAAAAGIGALELGWLGEGCGVPSEYAEVARPSDWIMTEE